MPEKIFKPHIGFDVELAKQILLVKTRNHAMIDPDHAVECSITLAKAFHGRVFELVLEAEDTANKLNEEAEKLRRNK